jgi:hypothetical protein
MIIRTGDIFRKTTGSLIRDITVDFFEIKQGFLPIHVIVNTKSGSWLYLEDLLRDYEPVIKSPSLDPSFDSIKPPIGIMPKKIWMEHRISELLEAIKRYTDAGINENVVLFWIDELRELCASVPGLTDKWVVDETKFEKVMATRADLGASK